MDEVVIGSSIRQLYATKAAPRQKACLPKNKQYGYLEGSTGEASLSRQLLVILNLLRFCDL